MISHLTPKQAYDHVTGQQQLAALPDASAWVSANAGSGKTKVLIDRVARLLLTGVQPDSILCITYTKAAASEMQQRLFKRLGSWSVMADDALADDLAELQGADVSVFDTPALKKARALFAKALETPGGLRIETLHAFAGRVLRRFPLEAGVPPGFTELDDVENGRIWESASRRTFLAALNDPVKREELRHLIRNIGGLGLQGVTDLIKFKATDLRNFLADYPDPQVRRAHLSEFLGAPKDGMAVYLQRLMMSELPRQDIGRAMELYRELGGKTDAQHADRLERTLAATDPEQALRHYRDVFLTGAGELRKSTFTKKLQGTLVDDLFHPATGQETNRILRGLEALSAIRLRDRTASLLAIAEPLLAEQTFEKRLQAGLDFDDLIIETRKLLSGQGLAEWVLYKLDGGISHVLLDEAQDTSPEQWRIVNALVAEFFAGASTDDQVRTLFVVGDEKQSIYSFQGADTAQFQSERQRFAARSAPDGEGARVHLPEIEMSFRTVPQVLDFVDGVFNTISQAGRAPFSTEIPTEADRIRHHAFRHRHRGQVDIWGLDAPDSGDDGLAWDAPLDMESKVSPGARLAQKIAAWIERRIQSDDQGVWEDAKDARVRKASAGDILILVRRRGALFHAIIQALKQRGVPVAGADRVNLLDTLAVQDVLNLVRFVLCPEDDLTLAEIIKGPFVGLVDEHDTDLFELAYDRGRHSIWSRLQEAEAPKYQAAAAFLRSVLARRHLPAFEFLDALLNQRHGAEDLTGWQMLDRRFGNPVRDPVESLLAIAGDLDDGDAASLQVFLDRVEHQNSDIKRELSGPADEVRVMTVHGAKGLEAPIVILPDTTNVAPDRLSGSLVFSEDDIPVWLESSKGECAAAAAIREREKARQVAESQRLLYVALTRARDHLVICGSWHGSANGQGYVEGSWYDLCLKGRVSVDGALDEEAENEDWQFGSVPPVEVSDANGQSKAPSQSVALPSWIGQSVRTDEQAGVHRAPSQLLPGDTPVLPPFGKQHLKRFQRGRLIHALLEILPEVAEADREARAWQFLASCLDPDEQPLADDVMQVTFRVLNAPELTSVFGPGGRAEAAIVGTGPHLPDGLIINGRVDRLRVTPDEVLVVDYKTDRPPPKRLEDVAMPYLAQMGAYFDVLSSTYPDKSVKCALLWTDGPHFMLLSESAMLDALKKARDNQ